MVSDQEWAQQVEEKYLLQEEQKEERDGILLYSSYNNVYGSGYCLILFMSGIFLQFYYVGDLVKEKKVNLHITYKNIKYMQKITALFIIMLLLMILRAKILRY